jgi:hypothetical protein
MSDVGTAAARLAQLASFYDTAPRPPVSSRRVQRIIAEIEAAVAPFTLPDELVELWSGWDAPSFGRLVPFPALVEPATALAIWREQRHPVGDVPAVLFPVAAERSCYLQLELVHQDWAGPRVWFHTAADAEYELQALSLAGYLDQAADAIVAGLVELSTGGQPFLGTGPGEEWDALVRASLDRAGVARHARRPFDWSRPERWPSSYRLAQGLDAATG